MLAQVCCSERSAHGWATALASHSRHRLKDMERERTVDIRTARRLVHTRGEDPKPPTAWLVGSASRPNPGLNSGRLTLFFGGERKDRGGGRLFGLKQFAEEQSAKLMQTNRRTWQSFDEMRKAAEQGDAAAQCYFGICYQTGQGVAQDYQEAVRWFRRAADQNDAAAQCYLGFCYQAGLGVPQEYGQAAKWFREAADQGDPAAQFNLGVLYETGQGVPQNYAEAVKWYHAAAEQGEPQAQFNLGVFYETGQVVPQNFEEAVKWYRLSAEQECAPAQCNLGLCYETGRGVPKNVREAVKWFCRAARAGDKTAQHNLGVYYATLEAAERPPRGRSPGRNRGRSTASELRRATSDLVCGAAKCLPTAIAGSLRPARNALPLAAPLQLPDARADPAAQAGLQLGEFAPRHLALQQVSDVRDGGAGDVLGGRVLEVHTRREVEAGLAEEVLHQGRAIHRAFARQQILPAAQLGPVQGDERAEEFAQ